MTQTTTAINACDVGVWLDNAGGTPKDIGGSSNSVDMNFDHDVKPFRTFGSKWPKRLECGKDASFTIAAIYSSTADEAFDILKDWYFATDPGNRTCSIYIPDKNVGSDMYSGEFKIKSLAWSNKPEEAGPIMVTAVLEPDGEVTLATAST